MPTHKHSSDLKMCQCRACRAGRGGGHNDAIQYKRRQFRRQTKALLRAVALGEISPEDVFVPSAFSAGYTD